MARKLANKSFVAPGWSAAQAATLDAGLAAKAGEGGPMGYCEMAGFLFAVACAPELVRPSEWLPEILGENMDAFGSLAEVQDTLNLDEESLDEVLGTLMMALGFFASRPFVPAAF